MATKIFPTVNDVGGGKTITETNFADLIAALCGATGFVISGFTFGTSANLTVTVAAGQALIDGYLVTTDASLTRTLTASATNYVYLQLTRDASQNVTGVALTHNTTGSAPADAILLGTATTSASAIISVDMTSKWTKLASALVDGLMSASDKAKLDGVADGANKYVHPGTVQCNALAKTDVVSGQLAVNTLAFSGYITHNRGTQYPLAAAYMSAGGGVWGQAANVWWEFTDANRCRFQNAAGSNATFRYIIR